MQTTKSNLGLTSLEVETRIKQGQTNHFKSGASDSNLAIIWQNLMNLPNLIIFSAISLLLFYGKGQDAFFISGVIILNTIISIFQEIQAKNFLKKIQVIKPEKVEVIRNGQELEIDPENIVIDDVIKISSGKYIYVDGVLIEGSNLLLDESVLTGESDYQKKLQASELMSGSFVVAGQGFYKATKVGEQSFVNKITKEARKYQNNSSPLQKNINNISKLLVYLSIGTTLLLLGSNFITKNNDQIETINSIISIVTSMIPQGIVITVTIALTIGVVKMAQKKIIVQKTNTVETMAELDILCMDKTGTLTANKFVVKDKTKLDQKLDKETFTSLISQYCIQTSEKNKTVLAIQKSFPASQESSLKVEVKNEIPFTSKTKYSALDLVINGNRYLIILGSLEALLGKIEASETKKLQELDLKYANLGRRNIFFVYKKINTTEKDNLLLDSTSLFKPLAFISIEDELRANASQIVQNFINQGVKPIIISGDGANTLQSIAKMLNVKGLDKIITGEELNKFTDKNEFDQQVINHDIFARVSPEQKVQIITSFQKSYKQVAMIGDGVNDALALKKANLGISLGSGADVTRNVADIVILDDSLASLSEVMLEGRLILFNTLRSAQLAIVKNIYSVIALVLTIILATFSTKDTPFIFNPRSLMILAFMIGNPPILTVLSDQRPAPNKINFAKSLYKFAILAGVTAGIMGTIIFILYSVPRHYSYTQVYKTPLYVQTAVVIFFILTGIFNYWFVINNPKKLTDLFRINRFFLLIPLLLGLLWLALNVEPVRNFFWLTPLHPIEYQYLGLAGLVYATIICLAYFVIFPLFTNKIAQEKIRNWANS